MATRKTSVTIDEALLSEVQRALDTRGVRDTIEKAFLEVLRVRARRDEVLALAEARDMDLADDRVMARAWRH